MIVIVIHHHLLDIVIKQISLPTSILHHFFMSISTQSPNSICSYNQMLRLSSLSFSEFLGACHGASWFVVLL